MRNEIERTKLFSRRCLFLAGTKLTLMGALASRLYYLQVIKSDEYKTLAESNRIKLSIILPTRGQITDRLGNILADNEKYYRVLYEPEPDADKEVLVTRLLRILDLSPKEAEQLMKKVLNKRVREPVLLYDHLSWEGVSKIEVNAPDLPGITIDEGAIRVYPYGSIAGHLLGYVGSVSKNQLNDNPLLNNPDFRIGKDGVERNLEERLRGYAGIKRMEVNAFGLTVRDLSTEPSRQGENIRLSIDIRLQKYIHDLFGERGAAAVVLDVVTGDILGLYSSPGFNPNAFIQGISHQEWQKLLEDPGTPLVNKTIARQYPPGSTFKTMVAIAAQREGAANPYTVINCPGYVDLGEQRFRCWKHEGHGDMTLQTALRESCNVFFYHMGREIGIEPIAEVARMFGLGELTGVPLPGEADGLIPTKQWKRDTYKKEWLIGDSLNSSIGQGFMLTTPLQLAVMTARLASGGKKVKPNLITSDSAAPPQWEELKMPKTYIDNVLEGMAAVVNHPRGTAYASRITDENFAFGGKSGTAQVISFRNQRGEVWQDQHHALFIGFAPVFSPRYAVTVVVEHGGSGGQAAAPLARDILWAVQQLQKQT